MDALDFEKSIDLDSRYAVLILLNILDSVNESALTESARLLRNYVSDFRKLRDSVLGNIKYINRKFDEDMIKAPTMVLYEKVHANAMYWVEIELSMYSDVIDSVQYLDTNKSYNMKNSISTSRRILKGIPKMKELKTRRGLQPKTKLVRKNITFEEFTGYIPDVLRNIEELILTMDKSLALNELFGKYKKLLKNKGSKYVNAFTSDEVIEFGRRELEFLALEANFASRLSNDIKFIHVCIKNDLEVYKASINELIRLIREE